MFESIDRPWRRRYELLEHLECLKLRRLSLAGITVAGVAYGSAATAVPEDQVVMVSFAPGAGAEEHWLALGAHAFHARAGRLQPLATVIHNAIATDGALTLKQHVRLVLRDGEVRGIEIHGPTLAHFCYIRSFVDLLDQFGLPDTVITRRSADEVLDHTLLYRRSDKQLVWDCRHKTLSLVRLGQPDAPAPRGRRQGLIKRRRGAAPAIGLPLGDWAPQPG